MDRRRPKIVPWALTVGLLFMSMGCHTTGLSNNDSGVRTNIEPAWIREGQPIEFEGENWFPLDTIDNLLDSEVYIVGRFQEVEFFVDRADVRPFNRLYTKFGRNKYRAFQKKNSDDSGQ